MGRVLSESLRVGRWVGGGSLGRFPGGGYCQGIFILLELKAVPGSSAPPSVTLPPSNLPFAVAGVGGALPPPAGQGGKTPHSDREGRKGESGKGQRKGKGTGLGHGKGKRQMRGNGKGKKGGKGKRKRKAWEES